MRRNGCCPTGHILVAGDMGLREALQVYNLHLIDWDSKLAAEHVAIVGDSLMSDIKLGILFGDKS